MEDKEVRPKEVQLGNFINVFGKVEMVTGIVPIGESTWFICHEKWNQKNNPMPDGVLSTPTAIELTDTWKRCLKIDKHPLPEWIQYVHEAQNYMKWYANVDLLEIMDWDLFTSCI